MKKSLIVGILGLAASAVSAFGQGTIALSNYSTSLMSAHHPLQDVIYGTGFGALDGTRVTTNGPGGPYTAGFFYVNTAGNYVANFGSDPAGTATPTALYSGPGTLTLASGLGATGGIDNADTGTPGEYGPSSSFNPGLGQGVTVTVMVIAYDGSSYGSATIRGHSTAFTMVTSVGVVNPALSGVSENDGGIAFNIPEPSVLALSGVGVAALMLVRRRKIWSNRC
jgi:hypothetical protein